MAREPREESRALTVVGEGADLPALPAPTNMEVAPAGAVAAGVLVAGLLAGGVALGRALARSIAQARGRDAQRSVVVRAGDRDVVEAASRVTRVTRVSMVVVEEWVTRGRAGGS